MSKSEGWPKWIKLEYFDPQSGGIHKYLGSAVNGEMLFENMDRLNIRQVNNICFMWVNEEQQSEEAVEKFMLWMENKREEKEIEERKKAQ